MSGFLVGAPSPAVADLRRSTTEVASDDVPDPGDLAMWDFGVDASVDLLVLSGVAPVLRVFRPDGGERPRGRKAREAQASMSAFHPSGDDCSDGGRS
jgi:hypothetical protein